MTLTHPVTTDMQNPFTIFKRYKELKRAYALLVDQDNFRMRQLDAERMKTYKLEKFLRDYPVHIGPVEYKWNRERHQMELRSRAFFTPKGEIDFDKTFTQLLTVTDEMTRALNKDGFDDFFGRYIECMYQDLARKATEEAFPLKDVLKGIENNLPS